jgi:valyl-tRNA synthetase
LNGLVKSITRKYERFDFGVAATELQQFFWAQFCDWYIEESKSARNDGVLRHVLATFLKLLAPIMPFVTEEIWVKELGMDSTLLFESFPTENKKLNFPRDAKDFDKHIELVRIERAAAGENETRARRIAILEKEILRGEGMQANKNFVANAPAALVEKERAKLAENRAELEKLKAAK